MYQIASNSFLNLRFVAICCILSTSDNTSIHISGAEMAAVTRPGLSPNYADFLETSTDGEVSGKSA